MVKFVLYLTLLSVAGFAGASDKQIFTIDDLRNSSESALQENEDAAARLQTLRSQSALEQSDKSFLTFQIDGYEFPAVLLPNERIAPAIVEYNKRTPACIDTNYQLHPGKYDPQSGRVLCEIRQADLLIDETIEQTSIGDVAVATTTTPQTSKYAAQASPEGGEPLADEPETNESEQPKPSVGTSKYVAPSQPSAATRPAESTSTAPQPTVAVKPDNVYIPPLRGSGNRTTRTYSVEAEDQKAFGIRKGTWAEVEIARRISSADFGEVEIRLINTIPGKFRDLPANTLLFAHTGYNQGSQRMNIQVTNALLPDEEEAINLMAYGYDLQRQAGLPGTIIRDREGEVAAATNQGVLTAVNSAVRNAPIVQGSPLTDGVETVTESLLDQENRFAQDAPTAVIEVPKQRFFIQIAKSF